MSPADLHAAVVAAVTARLELARAATPGPWSEPEPYPDPEEDGGWWIFNGRVGADEHAIGLTVVYNPRAEADARHIAANDPAAVIRACEADMERLVTHSPLPCGCCRRCQVSSFSESCPSTRLHRLARDCYYVRRIARVYGVEVR